MIKLNQNYKFQAIITHKLLINYRQFKIKVIKNNKILINLERVFYNNNKL
jgi:hypothetical protein